MGKSAILPLEIYPRLLFVSVQSVNWGYRAEQPVHFVLNAGGEKERRRRAGIGVISKSQGPQTVDRQDGIVRVLHEGDKFPSEAIEGSDATAAKITHQNRIA